MLLSKLTAEKKIPIYAFFELTRNCNLSCIHCYAAKERRKELSTQEIKEVIGQLKKENSLILNFSGGEAFVREDFFRILWYAKKSNFAIKIFSNGTLIGQKEANELAKIKPLRIEITIFSTHPEIHDCITGVNGSLGKSLRALKLLKDKNIPLRIKCPLLKSNASGYADIIGLAKSLEAKYQFDPKIIPKINGEKSPLQFQAGRKALFQILNDPKILENEEAVSGHITCSAGYNTCAISAYGDVFPCIILPIKLGNLKENKFYDIWHNSVRLKQLRSVKPQDLAKCHKCRILSFCNRCPGSVYLEKGNLLGYSKSACVLAKAKAESKYHLYS
ncbi:MAG: radical SAM protein [Candidatus Omnitrophota bacterium]